MIKEKEFRFKRKYFEMIKSGQKTLECRIKYPSLTKIKVGETANFFWENQSLKVRIKNIRYYKALKEMLSNEEVDRLVPGMSYQNALREYESIYPEWKVAKFNGLIVFEFEIV